MPTCKMCEKNVEKLVKSHIIPESFFRAMKKDSDHLLIVSSNKAEFTKKSWIGIYDQEILCLECESKFGALDDYGQRILLKTNGKLVPIFDEKNTPVGWILNESIDFYKLNKFFLSILYRASLSQDPFFQHVRLGPHQKTLKAIIENSKISTDPFSIFIRKFQTEKNNIAQNLLLDPRPIRIENIKYYQIYLGSSYVVYIKMDKRKDPLDFQKLIIGILPKLHLISGDLDNSSEISIIKKIGENLIKQQGNKRKF